MSSTLARPLPARPTAQINGADAIVRALEREAVAVCFGMPGGAILPLYDALARGTSVRHVLARHEQGAGHMAQGYARASGRPGVVIATSGPGATNLVTPIADARMDSTPARLHHRPGAPDADRNRRLPGMRHRRRDCAARETGLAGARRSRPRRDDPRGLPRRNLGSSRSSPGRRATRRAGTALRRQSRHIAHHWGQTRHVRGQTLYATAQIRHSPVRCGCLIAPRRP